ncbi:secondary thiamine-phosphate synthase enzyme YjbQ [bacterium]|nr:secondary thiamine-phosphate synthase enzyme YjbQ [bacterium]
MPTHQLTLSTGSRRQIVDITSQVAAAIAAAGDGLACISVPHCTCAVYVNENESGLVQDTLALMDKLSQGAWRHDRIDSNADAHLAATLIGNAVCLPIQSGKLVLGTWQRVMLVELDGPRRRTVHVTVV